MCYGRTEKNDLEQVGNVGERCLFEERYELYTMEKMNEYQMN